MGIRIQQGTTGIDAIRQTQDRLLKTFEQLGSGRRINRAGDDAAGLAISENLRAAERAFQTGSRNLSDGISIARTAEGALGEAHDVLQRMSELSIQAGNPAIGDNGKQALQQEFDQLAQELDRFSSTSMFGDRKLLDGSTQGPDALTIRDGSGGDEVIQISLDDHGSAALGVAGLDVSDPSTIDALQQAMDKVSATRADLGAVESRLSSGIRNLEQMRESTMAARSQIQDADVAKVAAEKTASQILQKTQLAVQGQAHLSSSLAASLLL